MNTKLEKRREVTLEMLKKQLVSGVKETKEGTIPLLVSDKERIKKEIAILNDRLAGKKKVKKMSVNAEGVLVKEGDKYYLDIMTISFSKVRHSDRRKNKGKSRKKSRTQKTTSLLKTVVLQAGMLQAYREGRMGLSPKTHSFRVRKAEEFTI